jgi:hypothetical protein
MSDYVSSWKFHPKLVGNIFASRFRSILFKCEIWLEEKYGEKYDTHKRMFPPWYEYEEIDKDDPEKKIRVPKLIDFVYPMNWPPFVHSEGGMDRAQFNLDHLWDIWYDNDFFYCGPSPEGYGSGKAIFAKKNTNLRNLDNQLVGYLESLRYMREVSDTEVEEEYEDHVFNEYYFNSMYERDALYGPLRGCNYRQSSGLFFKKSEVDIPVYSGLNYYKIKLAKAVNYKPEKYFFRCIKVPGVLLSSNSNTIDIVKGRQITVNYLGKPKPPQRKRPIAANEEKKEEVAEVYEFPPEKDHWNYPIKYAPRGRLYFNEIADDLDYDYHIVDESEMLKDGCTRLALYPPELENPIIQFPHTPTDYDRYEWSMNFDNDDNNDNNNEV